MQERLAATPKDISEKQAYLAISKLLVIPKEQWTQSWQDETFLKSFPNLVTHLISPSGREQFPEEQRAKLFADSLSTFIPKKTSARFTFTKTGEITTRANNMPTEETDSFTRTVIAFNMLIVMTLSPETKIPAFTKSYQDLNPQDRNFLGDQFVRLLAIKNATRAFIKEGKLDLNNAFEWDKELITFLLSTYKNRTKGGIIPEDIMNSPKDFSPQTINAVLDYVLENYDTLKRSTQSITLTDFTTEVEKFLASSQIDPSLGENMQKKFEVLTEKIGYKTSSPYSSELPGQINYLRS